jgi:hypothetical protein
MYEKAKTEAARPERLEQIIQELKQEQVDLINSI